MQQRSGFEVQGHRGARGLRPEHTLAGFELALDLGVSSIETDVHLTRDGVPVLFHDAQCSNRLCSHPSGGSPALPISRLTLAELRKYRVDRNPEPERFPDQQLSAGPVSHCYAEQNAIDVWTVPTLADLFALTAAYAGDVGAACGKSALQRRHAERVLLDVELKRVPFEPQNIGDTFDGSTAGMLERRVLAEAERAGVIDRLRVRSFDHRSVHLIRLLQPRLQTAVLIAEMAPVCPAEILAAASADLYCPDYRFVDAGIVRLVHDAGKTIVPWTVNEPEAWARLIAWQVDGITTDYPDRLLDWLRVRAAHEA